VTDKARKKYLYCNQKLNNANCVPGGILYDVFELVLLECLGASLAASGCYENKSAAKDLQIKIDAKLQELKANEYNLNKLVNLVLDAEAPQALVQKMKEIEAQQAKTKNEIETLKNRLGAIQRLPDDYRLLMAEIEKNRSRLEAAVGKQLESAKPAILKKLQKELGSGVSFDVNVKLQNTELRSTTTSAANHGERNQLLDELQTEINPTLPTDRFILREGFRAMVKKMVVDIAAQTTTTTWPNDKAVKFQLKRERHGNKGNTWFYRTAKNDDGFGEWKMIDPARLPQPVSRIAQ